jgi:hypothetical protein
MELQKLNCPACGAPITVPQDIDQLNCSSCGTYLSVKRGDGYAALKVAEKVAQAIEQTGKETQSAIAAGAEITRKELQRLQLCQDLSSTETRLTNIRTEIRQLTLQENSITKHDRNTAKRKTAILNQLNDLRGQEYTALNKIRILKGSLASLDLTDPRLNMDFLQTDLGLIHEEIAILRQISSQTQEIKKAISVLDNQDKTNNADITSLRLSLARKGLVTYQIAAQTPQTLSQFQDLLNHLHEDQGAVSKWPKSAEKKTIEAELSQLYKETYEQWYKLEAIRIQGMLQSHQIDLNTSDLDSLRSNSAAIQQDLLDLGLLGQNPVAKDYGRNLKEYKHRLDRKITSLQSSAAVLHKTPNQTLYKGPVSTPSQNTPAKTNWLIPIAIIGGILVICVILVILVASLPNTKTANSPSPINTIMDATKMHPAISVEITPTTVQPPNIKSTPDETSLPSDPTLASSPLLTSAAPTNPENGNNGYLLSLKDFEKSEFCNTFICKAGDKWGLTAGGTNNTYTVNIVPTVSVELTTAPGTPITDAGLIFFDRNSLTSDDLRAIRLFINAVYPGAKVDNSILNQIQKNVEISVDQICKSPSFPYGQTRIWAGKVIQETIVISPSCPQ